MTEAMILGILIVLIFMSAGIALHSDAYAKERFPNDAELDSLVAPAIQGKWATGIVVGLHDHGKTLVRGYGAFAGRKEPGKIVFEIGSVTKTFTGLLLADAAVRGKLRLDDPVARYVDFRIPDYEGKPIRFLDLATHTSGLPNVPDNFYPNDPKNPYASYTREKLVEFMKGCRLTRGPGARFEYSNLGMGMVGMILAELEGTDYEKALSARICGPLGLEDTRITLTESVKSRLAEGHDVDLPPLGNWDFQCIAGCGALRSTVGDLLLYLDRQMNPEKTSLAAAISLSQELHFRENGKGAKGLGWLVALDKEDRVYDHAGGAGGYTSFACFSPKHKVGIVVLSDAAGPVSIGVGFSLSDRMLKGESRPAPLPLQIILSSRQLERCAGLYRWDDASESEIICKGDALYFQVAGQPPVRLYPQSPTRFFLRNVPLLPIYLDFVTKHDGSVTGLILESSGQKVRALRIQKPGDRGKVSKRMQ